MIEIVTQPQANWLLKPYAIEDMEKLKTYKQNQILKTRIWGIQKQRSVEQLNTFMACCQFVANNVTEYDINHKKYDNGNNWNTKAKAAFMVKIALHFTDDSKTVVYNNQVHFYYRSLSFKNLKHLDACFFFDRAFPLLAMRLGMEVEDMIKAVKDLMFSTKK